MEVLEQMEPHAAQVQIFVEKMKVIVIMIVIVLAIWNVVKAMDLMTTAHLTFLLTMTAAMTLQQVSWILYFD